MTLFLYSLGIAFLLLLLYRFVVYKIAISRYQVFCTRFCLATGRPAKYLAALIDVWGMEHILLDLNRWTLDPYIVNQDLYQDMMQELTAEALAILAKVEASIAATRAVLDKDRNP